MFSRLVAISDSLSPQVGAFALALDWGRRLHAPLLGITTCLGATKQACADRCARFHVPWQCLEYGPTLDADLAAGFRPGDLLVVERGLVDQEVRERFMTLPLPVAVCSASANARVTRVVVLDRGDGEGDFLATAGEFCRALGAAVVVLTVASSERRARQQQQAVRQELACRGLTVDFDCFVGSDVCSAVSNVARWRQCSLAIVQRKSGSSWWSDRDRIVTQLAGIGDSLSLLTFPSQAGSLPQASTAIASKPGQVGLREMLYMALRRAGPKRRASGL